MGGELVQMSSSSNTLEDDVFEDTLWLATTSPSLLAGLTGVVETRPFDDDNHVTSQAGPEELIRYLNYTTRMVRRMVEG